MNCKCHLLGFCVLFLLPVIGEAQTAVPNVVPQSNAPSARATVRVPEQAAALLRPILDEKKKAEKHDERRLSNLIYGLTQKKGQAADEALVVLLCFYVGESQEDADSVIARGKKMLPYLEKYRHSTPKIRNRVYGSLLRTDSEKAETFEGVVKAIKQGWKSTADNPEG